MSHPIRRHQPRLAWTRILANELFDGVFAIVRKHVVLADLGTPFVDGYAAACDYDGGGHYDAISTISIHSLSNATLSGCFGNGEAFINSDSSLSSSSANSTSRSYDHAPFRIASSSS